VFFAIGCWDARVVSATDVVTFIVLPFFLVLAVVGLWFAQLIVIEGQKRFLHSLKHHHESLIRFTNFVGILFQSLCQWLGYEVTLSGVSEFHISMNDGTVTPKREKTGVLKWIADGFLFLGPFLLPAGLLLLAGYFVFQTGYTIPAASFTIQGQAVAFGTALVGFTQAFVLFLGNLDLLNPVQFGFLVLLMFCGLGIRPSYLGERRKEKVDLFTDLGNIKSLFLAKPLYILIIFVFIYVVAFISFVTEGSWFLGLVTVFAWIALIAILTLVLTFVLLIFLRALDEIRAGWRYVPFVAMVVSYLGFRVLFWFAPIQHAGGASLFAMLGVTLAVTISLLKWKTNTFKASASMKHRRDHEAKHRS
jgi:hypothetical protein